MSNQLINILCVEDSERDRDIILRCLDKTRLVQCLAKSVATAEEAVHMLEEHPFDFALVDYKLPDMDGIELTRTVIKEFPGTHVIMLTGLGDEKVAVEAMKAGASDYIVKDELRSTVLPRAISYILEKEEREEEDRRLREAEATIHEQRRLIEELQKKSASEVMPASAPMLDDEALEQWSRKYLTVFKAFFGARQQDVGAPAIDAFAEEIFSARLSARDLMEIHLRSLELLFEEEVRFTGHQEARIMLVKLLVSLLDRYQGTIVA